MSEFKPYLASAHIEGYKSIVNCDVTFKPGLNIIIGKNGTGKTNLLEGLVIAADFFPNVIGKERRFASEILISGIVDTGLAYKIKIDRAPAPRTDLEELPQIKLLADRDRITYSKKNGVEGSFAVGKDLWTELYLHPCFFPFAIKNKIALINDSDVGWTIYSDRAEVDDESYSNSGLVGAIPSLQATIESQLSKLIGTFQGISDPKEKLNDTKKKILNSLEEFIDRHLPAIKAFTPVTNIRVKEGQVHRGRLDDEIEASGFSFEFEVGGAFHPFDHLSDGSKRVLLIVIEVGEKFYLTAHSKHRLRFYLFEEPELGIHPHQLHLLMNFIKEQSKEKQIILTTHSPQVLDILNQDELDRIIIAEFDPEKGSTFRHLNEKEIKKARFIMKDEPLSSYWRHSDLERSLVVK